MYAVRSVGTSKCPTYDDYLLTPNSSKLNEEEDNYVDSSPWKNCLVRMTDYNHLTCQHSNILNFHVIEPNPKCTIKQRKNNVHRILLPSRKFECLSHMKVTRNTDAGLVQDLLLIAQVLPGKIYRSRTRRLYCILVQKESENPTMQVETGKILMLSIESCEFNNKGQLIYLSELNAEKWNYQKCMVGNTAEILYMYVDQKFFH